MTQQINQKRLFYASCFALITTAFSFSIRAGILPQLANDFGLTAEQLGYINSMWFFGFPIAMIIGGLVYHSVGPKRIMMFAFVSHTLGILLTIYADGYTSLLISTFFIGLGNGCTEAACNPMIADMYSGHHMNKMLNRFHMWFPGGIFLGSLVSAFMTAGGLFGVTVLETGFPWQAQIWLIMIPTVIYAILFFGQRFPQAHVAEATSLAQNFKAMFTPLFIFIFLFMFLTAITEFGPQQWVGVIMGNSGANPMLILALTTGLMAVGRYFAGPLVHKIDQTGVLLGSAIFATIGIYLFSTQTGAMAYVAAIFFAIGVCYFWPTMLGVVAQHVPLSGALGLSIVGGAGMFSSFLFQPIIGRWIDTERAVKTASGLTGEAMELAAGQATLLRMTTFPIILIVAFTVLFFVMRKRKATAEAEEKVLQQPVL